MKAVWASAAVIGASVGIASLDACSLIYTGDNLVGQGPPDAADDGRACDKDCLGGACISGVCQPSTFAEAQHVSGLAVDATFLYWTTLDGVVARRPLAGGDVETITDAEPSPARIAVDGSHLYWSAGVAIRRRAVAGGPIETVATAAEEPSGLCAMTDFVFWSETRARVVKKHEASGDSVLFANLDAPAGLACNIMGVFLVGGPGQVLSPSAFSGPHVIVDGQNVSAIAVAASHVYFASGRSGTIGRYTLTSATLEPILLHVAQPGVLAADGTGVYWAEPAEGRIRRQTF